MAKGRSSRATGSLFRKRGGLFFLLVPLGLYVVFVCWDSYRRSTSLGDRQILKPTLSREPQKRDLQEETTPIAADVEEAPQPQEGQPRVDEHPVPDAEEPPEAGVEDQLDEPAPEPKSEPHTEQEAEPEREADKPDSEADKPESSPDEPDSEGDKPESTNDEASEQVKPKEETSLTDLNEAPETTVRCVGGSGDRSCLFKNLYYHRGRFAMFVLKGPDKPIEVQRAVKYEGGWKPDIEVFSSVQKIKKRVKDSALIDERGLSVQFNPLFHSNIGHAIFDGLYPAFYAMVKLKVQDRPFRPVPAVDAGCFEEGASGSLNPGDLVEAYLPQEEHGRTLRAAKVRIVDAPSTLEKEPQCKWKGGFDHNGLDLGSENVGQGNKAGCLKACALSFGCKAAVLYEGICYLKGSGGSEFGPRSDRPGIKMCKIEGEGPKADIVVKPEPGFDGEMKKYTIPNAWIVGKVRRRCMSEGIYETFGMTGEMRRLFELERDCRNNPKILIRFEELVVGVGGAGNMIADKSGAIGGSLPPKNAMSQFRDRMLRAYGLPVPESGVKPLSPDRPLNVIVISNKRFNVRGEDRRLLNDIISKLNHKGGVHAEMIDWGSIGNPFNKFKEHLKRTQKADVYVSSIGTALQYVPFMRDGKVYVALGSVWMRSGQYFPTFMEQQLAGGGTPYLRTLYADPGGVLRSSKNYPRLGEDGYFCGVNGTLVYELMERAEVLVRKGFQIPVSPEENLSVEGQILVELCKRDAASCKTMINHRNGGHGMQLLWNECVVYEVGPWRKGGLCGSQHHKLLRQLRKEYGIGGYGAPES